MARDSPPDPGGSRDRPGKDLFTAVESAGVLRVHAAEADLAALQEARSPKVPRAGEMHHAVLEPLLRDAGCDVAVHRTTLRLRKHPLAQDTPATVG
jgi:hypothetical protein